MNDLLHVVVYGLVAAASPGVLVATLAVLGTRRARANGLAFAAGFVLGQTAALATILVLGAVTVPKSGSGTATAALELAIGLLLLAAAYRTRRPRKGAPVAAGTESRFRRLLGRLEGVTPKTAFSIAVPLGVGVKRLLITIFAASTIALSGSTRIDDVWLGLVYVTVATVVVWAPVGLYLVPGRSADEAVARSKEWIGEHQRQLTALSSLVFGLLFAINGLVELV